MKNRVIKAVVISLVLVILFGVLSASAYEAYDTYTYSIDGLPLKSPAAYSPVDTYDSYGTGLMAMTGTALNGASDITSDEDGNIYIADTLNNRIVVYNHVYEVTAIIDSYVDEYGNNQTLNGPRGVFVSKRDRTVSLDEDPDQESRIYVCDTKNERVVVFRLDGTYERSVEQPATPLLEEGDFTPIAVAVDKYGRIFVVSETCYQGVIVLSSYGDFTGFIGAQKVTSSLLQQIWSNFQTEEQKAAQNKNISVSYNNITVDDDGFVFVTNNKIDKAKQYAALTSKSADYSPVKKLNSTGVEIMKRNGFFDPGGEVVDSFNSTKVSNIVDITLGPEGSWTILDRDRSRFYTYDQEGNLLFAFGDKGSQLGNGEDFVAVTYQVVYEESDVDENGDGELDMVPVYRLVALDNTATGGYKITAYNPTDYCNTIIAALEMQNKHLYDSSIDYWQDVLTSNNNFDLAYIGIGKALYSQGEYEEAMLMLQRAYETTYASKVWTEMRKEFVQKWVFLIVIGAIVLIWAFFKFLTYAGKKNKATTLKVGKKTYWEELLFAFHLVFHPFDGFWDLKHEKRGSVRAATTFIGITVLAFFYNSIGKGYLFNPRGTYQTIFMTALSIILPVALWIVGNWCLTTLFDGEGSFKDIYIATGYALAPMPLFVVASTILSNIMTTSEGKMVNLIITFGFVWVAILLFFGTLVTHDYSLSKNVITILGTIVAMIVIMFIIILFSSLVVKMAQFAVSIYSEIANRL